MPKQQLETNARRERVKEADKLGEDNVSHAVVYDAEAFHPNRPSTWPSYRQHYLHGDAWVELYFRVEIGGNPCEYVAVLNAAPRKNLDPGGQISSVDVNTDLRGSENPMFIDSVKFVQQGKRVSSCLVSIPSLIRLFSIHDLPHVGPDRSLNKPELAIDERIIGNQPNRKAGTSFGDFSLAGGQRGRKLGQGVDDVVQSRPNLITELSDSDTKIEKWWHEREQGTFVERLIRIELTEHACWIERLVSSEVVLDGFQVLFCPLELKHRPFKRMRFTPALKIHDDIYLPYGEPESEQAKNARGPRNTCANAGRVRDELSQGGEAGENITDSPPEEGLTRTSPDHDIGGYNTKHACSGSLGDV